MSLNINNSDYFNTTAPYNYKEWLQLNSSVVFEDSADLYNQYISLWYQNNTKLSAQNINTIKQDYINLLRELTYFFSEEEKNLFLKDINFNDDIEIIYAIPFFVQKLKEIALNISKKRETLKKSKQKYLSIGSSRGLENILKEYILTSHTKNQKTTQISTSSLANLFPDLSAIKDVFTIEIEELYDTGSYAGEDPAITTNSLDDIPRVANNTLFSIFSSFLEEQTNNTLQLSSYSGYTIDSTANVLNEIALNTKYIGSTLYGLTAIPYTDTPDNQTNLSIVAGNNWFYWPSGETFTDTDKIQNTYKDIALKDSVFTLNGVAGASYTDSDLFFVESRGSIEGAWLRGTLTTETSGQMVMTSQPNEIRSIIFPYPGYGLTTTYKWAGRALDDGGLYLYNLLDPAIKAEILKSYYNSALETDTISPLYINQTNLVYSKAHAGTTSLHGDSILKRPAGPYNENIQKGVFNDTNFTQEAYLYKLTSTELVIGSDDTFILWPITTYTADSTDIETITISADTCKEIFLGNLNINEHMVGAVAGTTTSTSDVIYKMSKKEGTAIEAAWLQAGSVKTLANYNSYSIPIYDIPASACIETIDGPIQPNLSFVCSADEKVSFVWCDIDTPADEVFKNRNHTLDCPYVKNKNSHLTNTDSTWTQCTCKALHFSPIGHIGEKITDYYGAADYLFADPQNMNINFSLSKWRDTRKFNFQNSPQFSYFKISKGTNEGDAGWAPGYWQTGDNQPMILKTGRQYTYFRSSLRNLNTETTVPSFVAQYPYKLIITSTQTDITADTILVIDASGSQYYSIEKTKKLATTISNYIDTTKGSQVGVVIFNEAAITACYLTSSKAAVIDTINSINIEDTKANSNINNGLEIAYKLLTEDFVGGDKSLAGACTNLKLSLSTPFSLSSSSNIPKDNNLKNIVIFSDGHETITQKNTAETANTIKLNGITIISIDIGPNSSTNNLMERIASTYSYLNYEKSLIESDTAYTINDIANQVIFKLYGSVSAKPIWRKALLSNETATESYEISDMMIRPGDYIKYSHSSIINYKSFKTKSGPFIINVPLYGWNYNTNSFDNVSRGAKPYWGKVNNYPNSDENFTKFNREMGGNIKYVYEYIPTSHPKISDITLNINDYVEYRNRGCEAVSWKENIKFITQSTERKWLKLKSCVQPANLRDIFSSSTYDKIFEQTEEESNIVLRTYSDFTPAYYCYYALSGYNANQPLFYTDREIKKYSQAVTGIVITPNAEYMNLTNTHYASIASIPNVNNLITKSSIGGYLLPHKLGVPYYVGYGYSNALDIDKLDTLDSFVFADPTKYTSNRGLTKKDQNSPFITTNIDNTWMKENYNSGKKSGSIINSIDYQKFVPYQSSYETLKYNIFGISRQEDVFEFWSGPGNNIWNDETAHPTNFKKEPYQVAERTKKLLVTDKILNVWQTDIFGNNYGILKPASSSKIESLTTPGELWVRNVSDTIESGPDALKEVYNKYIEYIEFYNDIVNNNIINIQIFQDVLCIKTANGIIFEKIAFTPSVL